MLKLQWSIRSTCTVVVFTLHIQNLHNLDATRVIVEIHILRSGIELFKFFNRIILLMEALTSACFGTYVCGKYTVIEKRHIWNDNM